MKYPTAVLRLALCTVLTPLTVACTDGESGADSSTTNPAGAQEGGWAGAEPWRLESVWQLGALDGSGPDVFGNPVGLEIDPLGRVWVLDTQAHEIRVFDGEGRHVRSIGRRGGGPGEFAQLAGAAWGPDGNLWVFDGGNSRFAVLDTAGTVLRTVPRPPGTVTVPWPGTVDESGHVYDLAPVPDASGGIANALVRFSPELEPRDTFRLPAFEAEFFELVTDEGRNRQRVTVPFTGSQIWRVDRGGRPWTATTDEYRLLRHDFNQQTDLVVERQHTPVRVTGEELDRILENFQWFVDQGGRIDRSRIPREKPAIATFFFDDRNRPWVLPVRPQEEPVSLDVFGEDGTYMGRIASPVRLLSTPAPVVRGDWLAGRVQSPDGVPAVALLRIRRD
jgi:hypothetical protein